MYYFDGFTQQEIADRLGIINQAVSQHIAAGVKKLTACGMRPERLTMDAPPKITTMDPGRMDQLGPEQIKAVW